MSDSENDQKRELECLRLASDLTQLAKETLNPDLKAHCLRMAAVFTSQVHGSLEDECTAIRSLLYH